MAEVKPEKPTTTAEPLFLGRIVHYVLTAEDVRRLDNDRITTLAYGNRPKAGDTVPVIVVGGAYADDENPMIHAQAFLDGNDRLWLTNVTEGNEPGEWHAIPGE